MEERLIIEQFDPDRPKPGGIDTCIRGLISYAPDNLLFRVVGVDALGNKALGRWNECCLGGKNFLFMPVARLDHANLRRTIPHSVNLALGIRRYLSGYVPKVVQTHRINMGAFALRAYPNSEHVQFLHSSGTQNLGKGSRSFFRHAVFAYRLLENYVIPRSREAIVFSRSGADRLSATNNNVRFSPTWFDPASFYPIPQPSPRRTSILWACRIEPAKNPLLAIDTFNALPEHYSLTIAGSGTLEDEMRAAAARSPAASRIKFLGAVPKEKMGDLMREHDILLMTSRFEGFSRSIVEALACGLPVVTTPGGEPNGLIVDGVNGARAETDDAQVLAAAFDRLELASREAVLDSVRDLSAATIVPSLLSAVV